ncbi:MAG TPA: hypothetical protein PLB45_02625 [Bacilli bacterium]|jgi:hypothetical protein|nr:hypothetical protein [Bacilli bacterium]HQC83751.1 hypothetical protein [Bacilli bacterium]
MENDKKYEQVGNIAIKESKHKSKKNKYNEASLGVKVFVWVMFAAMFASFIVPLIYYFIEAVNK